MIRTAELNMAISAEPNDIADFLNNAAWAVRSTYHTILKASPGTANFGWNMLFNVSFLADWNKVGDYRQRQTDRNTARETKQRVDWGHAIGDEVLLGNKGTLRKSKQLYEKDPWTVSQLHTNETIRIQRGTKLNQRDSI